MSAAREIESSISVAVPAIVNANVILNVTNFAYYSSFCFDYAVGYVGDFSISIAYFFEVRAKD